MEEELPRFHRFQSLPEEIQEFILKKADVRSTVAIAFTSKRWYTIMTNQYEYWWNSARRLMFMFNAQNWVARFAPEEAPLLESSHLIGSQSHTIQAYNKVCALLVRYCRLKGSDKEALRKGDMLRFAMGYFKVEKKVPTFPN